MNNPCLTLKRVIALGPCHSAETIRAWYPDRKRVHLSTVLCDDRIEHDDKAWISVRVLPRPVVEEWLEVVVERAIRRVAGKSGCPAWETWAARWLDGTDRSMSQAEALADSSDVRGAPFWAAIAAYRLKHEDEWLWAATDALCASVSARERCEEQDRQIAELLAITK